MTSWKDFIINKNFTIKEAMLLLNTHAGNCLYVADLDNKVLGSITDGDIRRALLDSKSLTDNITLAMKANYHFCMVNTSEKDRTALINKYNVQSLPVLDENLHIVDIFTLNKSCNNSDIPVVLLAGGMGTRLGDITKHTPKPMVEVAGEPILLRIINKLKEFGFSNFFISVNYKAEIIENYFQNGKNFNCKISYLKENKRLGTAGPLSLLEKQDGPILIMNGDLLTYVNIHKILCFHREHNAKVTMCTRSYEMQVPFGVVNIADGLVTSFEEKPTFNFNVNAGIYVIEPEIVQMIPKDEYYDMSTLLNTLIDDKKHNIACFPIIENWIDVGRESDLQLAHETYLGMKK